MLWCSLRQLQKSLCKLREAHMPTIAGVGKNVEAISYVRGAFPSIILWWFSVVKKTVSNSKMPIFQFNFHFFFRNGKKRSLTPISKVLTKDIRFQFIMVNMPPLPWVLNYLRTLYPQQESLTKVARNLKEYPKLAYWIYDSGKKC